MVMLMLFIMKFTIVFLGKCAYFQRSLSQSLIVCCAVNNTLTFFGSCLVFCLLGLISLLVLLGLLGLMGFIGLLGKKEIHETHETHKTHET